MSRGVAKCLKLLEWYASRFKDVHPLQGKLSVRLGVSDRQLRRYLLELRHHGLITVQQQGPQSASYDVSKAVEKERDQSENVRPLSGLCPGFEPALRVKEVVEPLKRRTPPPLETLVAQTLEPLRIKGQPADVALIDAVVRILRTTDAHPAFAAIVGRVMSRREKPYSWGIMPGLARQAAATKSSGNLVAKSQPSVINNLNLKLSAFAPEFEGMEKWATGCGMPLLTGGDFIRAYEAYELQRIPPQRAESNQQAARKAAEGLAV